MAECLAARERVAKLPGSRERRRAHRQQSKPGECIGRLFVNHEFRNNCRQGWRGERWKNGNDSSASSPRRVSGHKGRGPCDPLAAPAGVTGIGRRIGTRRPERAVLPLPHFRVRAQGHVAGVEGDHSVRRPEGIRGTVRPGIRCRVLPEAGAGPGASRRAAWGARDPLSADRTSRQRHPPPADSRPP